MAVKTKEKLPTPSESFIWPNWNTTKKYGVGSLNIETGEFTPTK